ncbi:MAG TPA: PAS domain-containing protein [Deltaproteobacteria bacterium]|nr:PAS domain-containing protein [Deltaproteobacteria bacterium]
MVSASVEEKSVDRKEISRSLTFSKPLKIAVIGGGTRCAALLSLLEKDRLRDVPIEIVAVADHNPDAAGFREAKKRGIYTTEDFKELVNFPEVDLIIELTGNEKLLEEVLPYLPPQVQILDYAISKLLGEIILLSEGCHECNVELDFTRNFVAALWNSVADRILLLDEDYKIIDINPSMQSILGAKRSDVIGRYCYQVMHQSLSPCNTAKRPCPLQETLKTGLSAQAIHEHHDPNKGVIYYEVVTYPFPHREGQKMMVIEIFRDITSEVKEQVDATTKRIKKNLARLVHEDKMIALGKLVASSVHEINNPISGIHALSKLMYSKLEEGRKLNEEDLEEFRNYLALISKESARCGEIVSNLLSFSRQQKMEARKVNINEILQTVLTLCRHRMSLQKIELEEELADDLPEVIGDYNHIQQCFINVVFNAIEAMPEGGKLTVRTRYEKEKKKIRIDICDTGCGIPEENISRIFEPFFSTKTDDKGVGLGLSVVYGIMREHRGSIFVDSKVGKGTCFIIRFPEAGPNDNGVLKEKPGKNKKRQSKKKKG